MDESAAHSEGKKRAQQDGLPFALHPLRDDIMGEVHARPFRPIDTPRVIHHLAFLAGEPRPEEHEALARFCAAHGALPPDPGARHHVVSLGNAEIRWERHTEFVTLTLSVAPPPGDPFTAPKASSLAAFLPKVPGELIVATRLALVEPRGDEVPLDGFDPTSFCASLFDGGNGRVTTDFRVDASGFTRILVENFALHPTRAGAMVQRLLEIETYRTLALLGLPEAQRLAPIVGRIEQGLLGLIREMREASSFQSGRELLDRLTGLAAEIESEAAASAYRFSATVAYEEIVNARLASLREQRIAGYSTVESFLGRRMRPAMRTVRSVGQRLAALSEKLARASNLLRTRVDIELESQNRDLLHSMNRRARQQLRLQRTVEGLSVAAISYYVVGLVAYVVKGGKQVGWPFDPVLATAAAVPLVILLVWLMVRRVRRHADDGPG